MMQKEEYLELGLIYVREGNLKAAMKSLHTAMIKYAGLENPQARPNERVLDELPLDLLSYYGLCIALTQNRTEEGLKLCRRALAKDTLRPDYYLNAGKIYVKINQKAKALKYFQRGLEISQRHKGLMNEMKKMGIRKRQVFGFLPRRNILNRYAGVVLQRLGVR